MAASLTVDWTYCGNGESSFNYTCSSYYGDCAGLTEFPGTTCTVQGNNTFVTCISATKCNGMALLSSSTIYLRRIQQWDAQRTYTTDTSELIAFPTLSDKRVCC